MQGIGADLRSPAAILAADQATESLDVVNELRPGPFRTSQLSI